MSIRFANLQLPRVYAEAPIPGQVKTPLSFGERVAKA